MCPKHKPIGLYRFLSSEGGASVERFATAGHLGEWVPFWNCEKLGLLTVTEHWQSCYILHNGNIQPCVSIRTMPLLILTVKPTTHLYAPGQSLNCGCLNQSPGKCLLPPWINVTHKAFGKYFIYPMVKSSVCSVGPGQCPQT